MHEARRAIRTPGPLITSQRCPLSMRNFTVQFCSPYQKYNSAVLSSLSYTHASIKIQIFKTNDGAKLGEKRGSKFVTARSIPSVVPCLSHTSCTIY
jgi:hypothetical protein